MLLGFSQPIARDALAQWSPSGAALCPEGKAHLSSAGLVIPDGQGGLFAAWQDYRTYPVSRDDVYLQRLTAGGYIAERWPSNGVAACTADEDQIPMEVSPDGQGGVLVTWIDQRGLNEVYVQRITAAGVLAAGWPENGAAVTSGPSTHWKSVVQPDGLGGAFVAWEDDRNLSTADSDIFVQHLAPTGEVSPGWPVNGLPVCIMPAYQGGRLRAIADGSGGVVVLWGDARNAGLDTYGVRLSTDGQRMTGWAENGTHLAAGQTIEDAIADGAGGFYLITSTRELYPGWADGYFVHRYSFTGERPAGWPVEGVLVCLADGPREGMRVALDGQGGLLLTWFDYRIPGGVIYASRILPDGSLAPGWTTNGTLLSDPTEPGVEYESAIGSDGAGGAYVAWIKNYANAKIFVQHLTAQGLRWPGWAAFGQPVAVSPGGQFHPEVVADGAGGAIVVWEEATVGRLGLYAQKFQLDGAVPATLALVSAAAEPGRVRLVWQGAEAANRNATVERRSGDDPEWLDLASVTSDASGLFEFEDTAVEPGSRYAYRLRWREDGIEHTTEEAWVEVPPALALALHGLRPNPAVRDLNVSFVLPTGSPARLEILDVNGRQRLARELGDRGPGFHTVLLGDAASLEPGVYWIRLSQGSDHRVARGAVIR